MLLAAPTDVVALNFFFDTLLSCGAMLLTRLTRKLWGGFRAESSSRRPDFGACHLAEPRHRGDSQAKTTTATSCLSNARHPGNELTAEDASRQAAMSIKQRHRLRVSDVLTFRRANQKLFENIGGQHSYLPNPARDSMGEHVYSIKLKKLIE